MWFNGPLGKECTRPLVCFKCNGEGHWASECRAKGGSSSARGRGGRNYQQRGYAAMGGRQSEGWNTDMGIAEFNEIDQYGFMAKKFGDRVGPDVFLLDSAATSHRVDEAVNLLDEEQVDIEIKGVAVARAVARGTLVAGGIEFKNVLKVKGLGVNLISEGVLHGKGCDVISNAAEGWRRVVFKGKVLIQADYEQGLFVWRPQVLHISAPANYPICLLASGAERYSEQQLWHLRMGHLNYADLGVLKHMSEGMDYKCVTKQGLCVSCCRGKMAARPFQMHNEKATHAFQIIYADLWGQWHAHYRVTNMPCCW